MLVKPFAVIPGWFRMTVIPVGLAVYQEKNDESDLACELAVCGRRNRNFRKPSSAQR